MSLSKEKIIKNAKKFNETASKYGFINDELINLLGQEFISAPACSTTNLYNAFEGGLVHHILTTTKYAVSINEMLPEEKQVKVESLRFVFYTKSVNQKCLLNKNHNGIETIRVKCSYLITTC